MNRLQATAFQLLALALGGPDSVIVAPERKYPKSLLPAERPKGEATEEQKRMTLHGRRGKGTRRQRRRGDT